MPTTVAQLEQEVYELEEVRIVVRAPKNTVVGDFVHVRKAPGNSTVTEWQNNRIKPLLNGYEVVVIDGDGHTARGSNKMETLRRSYDR